MMSVDLDSRSVNVKVDVRINGVARVRHCVGHPASPRLRTYTRLLGAAGGSKHKVKAVYFTANYCWSASILEQNLLTQLATLATFSSSTSLCERTVMMHLSCLPEQLVRSSEQLVLMDTKKGVLLCPAWECRHIQ